MTGSCTVFFDCDQTLVMWGMEEDSRAIVFEVYDQKFKLVPHQKHIDRLKFHKAEGFKIVCWSAGGEDWAKTIVKTLGLEQYVDYCLSKPSYYYDDLPTEKILHKHHRMYYEFK
jgi:phosphoserine phosphatase